MVWFIAGKETHGTVSRKVPSRELATGLSQ